MQDQQYQLPVEIDPLIGMLSFMTVKESTHTYPLHSVSSYMHEMIFCVDLCMNPAGILVTHGSLQRRVPGQ